MALIITPEVFFELLVLCLAWEWEKAVDRAKASHNRPQPLHPVQMGWTTVDKIARILFGLGVITQKQKSALYKDRRLQHLVLRRSEQVGTGDSFLFRVLERSGKDLVLQCDMVEEVNREKMLRNMRFYATEHGHAKANSYAAKYRAYISKEKYFTEIERQSESLPSRPSGTAAVMNNYRKKVAEETKQK